MADLDPVGDLVALDVRRVEAGHREVRGDGARGRLAGLEPHVVDHELAVDRVGHGLAHLDVVEGRLRGVEVQLHDGRRHLVALGRGDDVRDLGQRGDVAPGDGGEAGQVHVALLDGGRPGGRVGDEAGHDAVEIRAALAPVVRVAVQADELAPPPLHELEGAGADRLVGVLAGLRIGALEEVFGEHRRLVARERHHQIGRRIGQPEDHRMLVRRVDLGHLTIGPRAPRVQLAQDLLDAELHVGAGEGLAVVEADAVLELEGDGLAVRADRPGLGQPGSRLEVEVVLEEPLVDLAHDLADGARGALVGGQRGRLGLHEHDERAAPLLGLGRAGQQEQFPGQQHREQR